MLSKSIPLKYFISRRSVVNPNKFLGEQVNSNVTYKDKQTDLEVPVVPLMAFGMHFEIDIVIALKNDNDWGMIEIFPVTIPTGERLWFSLDSKLDGSQYIGLPKNYQEHKDKFHFLFPGVMYEAKLTVVESGNQYNIGYTRIDGAEVKTEVILPSNAIKSMTPNGNTMNHSIQNSSIVLYLEKMGFISKGFKFNFDPNKVDRILGKRILMQLVQTAVGFMKADWEQAESSLTCNGTTVPSVWDKEKLILTVKSFPEVNYHFVKNQDHLELNEINIIQNKENIGHIQINPSLPDFRYNFTGSYNSKMTISIKDFKGLLKGEIKGKGSSRTIMYRPISPHWAKNRPIDTQIINQNNKLIFKSTRTSMKTLPTFIKVIHYGIILHLLINIAYSAIQLFVFLQPDGVSGPLFGAALTMDHDLMVTRRLYAVEHWISVSGLSIYLAITEIYPRIKKANA